MLVGRARSCKEGRYGIFLQLYTKVKAQPTWGSLSRSSALASADLGIDFSKFAMTEQVTTCMIHTVFK